MKISISNIAWDVSDDELIANKLVKYGIYAIDIAPGKYFSEPLKVKDKEIKRVKDWWATNGIEIIGMQSLLFGTKGLNLFDTHLIRKEMLMHLESICHIGSELGAKHLVFGSPKNRDRSNLSDDDAIEIAIPFFSELGEIALKYNVEICIEPNPTVYGANFLTTTKDAAVFVQKVKHRNIKLQLDTSTVIINEEDLENILIEYSHLIGHVHASEPNLLPYGHDKFVILKHGRIIQNYLPNHYVTIEMLKTSNDNNFEAINKAIETIQSSYI